MLEEQNVQNTTQATISELLDTKYMQHVLQTVRLKDVKYWNPTSQYEKRKIPCIT